MFILLYMPPCGKWYVHSHKMYETRHHAQAAAMRFLYTHTPFKIINVSALMEQNATLYA